MEKKTKWQVIRTILKNPQYGETALYTCGVCGGEVEAESCDQCEDGLSYHDCGEDTCCCLDPSPNVICNSCGGTGYWWYCLQCKAYIKQGHEVQKPEEGGKG